MATSDTIAALVAALGGGAVVRDVIGRLVARYRSTDQVATNLVTAAKTIVDASVAEVASLRIGLADVSARLAAAETEIQTLRTELGKPCLRCGAKR